MIPAPTRYICIHVSVSRSGAEIRWCLCKRRRLTGHSWTPKVSNSHSCCTLMLL